MARAHSDHQAPYAFMTIDALAFITQYGACL